MAGDAACLASVLRSLDEYTIVVMRGSEEHADDDLALVQRALARRGAGSGGGGGGGLGGGRHLGTAGGAGGGGAGGGRYDAVAAIARDVQVLQARPVALPSVTDRMRTSQHASCSCTARPSSARDRHSIWSP
jgi:hypothetical protein